MALRQSLPERRLDSVIQANLEIGSFTSWLEDTSFGQSSLPSSDLGVPAAVTTLSSARPRTPQACMTCVSVRR